MPSETFKIKNFEISSLNDFLKAIIKDNTILEYKSRTGSDAYLLASYYGHLEIMKHLEKEHKWDIHVKDNKGSDAYLLASYYSQLEIMKYLENEHNWDIHVNNINGNDAYVCGNSEIRAHLNEMYKKEKEEKKYSKLEEQLKQEKEKNSKLEEELKKIKETIKNILS